MKLNFYQKTAIITVIATVVLIFVGGLVRAAGAGLGCPDWPQCFGMWIPPTTVAELPAQYDASLFNSLHTWLEYINRLIGVLIGFLITLTFAASFKYRKTDRIITYFSGLAFVMVLFQGWLGGQVVRSGLSAGMITIHMIVAMALLATLFYATFRSLRSRITLSLNPSLKKHLLIVAGALLFITLAQMIMGTQIRESVDFAKNVLELPRGQWIDSLGGLYSVHRSFSWLLVALGGYLVYQSRSQYVSKKMNRLSILIALLIVSQMFIGVGMERLGMMGVFQVLHLVGVAILICAELLYLFVVWFSNKQIVDSL
ncbi:MAG TPA: COX15/CtaA family protein [Balneolaceae bacterium]|nr:COX15/CtaA family protein [Balneolaceae bacterium]